MPESRLARARATLPSDYQFPTLKAQPTDVVRGCGGYAHSLKVCPGATFIVSCPQCGARSGDVGFGPADAD